MENEFTPEILEKAKAAKSVEELLALAKENGIDINEDGAKAYFEQLNRSGEVSDEELNSVSGGGCFTKTTECPKCHSDRWKGGICFNCGYHTTLIM